MPSRSDHRRFVLGTLAAVLVLGAAAGCSAGDPVSEQQSRVAERGADVMPFDLDATTHVFTKSDDGGNQVVRADDPNDQVQIGLVREHLTEERDNFARGDFDDPAQIHGHDMPGVADLAAGYADIAVTYVETPDGAELTYTTDDPQLVVAIHAWFDRQLEDHGDDATAG
jgi:hypothetical protein